jgi:hypothetical protein
MDIGNMGKPEHMLLVEYAIAAFQTPTSRQ